MLDQKFWQMRSRLHMVTNTFLGVKPIMILFLKRSIAACAVFLLAMASGFGTEPRHVLHGHVPMALARLSPGGLLPATNVLHLAIGLPLRDPAGLKDFLRQVYDPSSPNFRKFLTPEQFTEQFGPTAVNYQKVIAFAQANGLRVTGTHGNRVLLDVSGSVTQIEKAFHVTLHLYQHPHEGRKFFAPDVEPSVDLAVPLADVSGLDDYSVPQPRHVSSRPINYLKPAPKAGTGPGNTFVGTDFRNAYAPGTTLNGAGQMVGLLQFDGFYSNDIVAYENLLPGSPRVPLQTVLLDGFSGGIVNQNGNAEVSLDIEMAIAMAPGLAKIVVFEAPNSTAYFNDILNAMAASNQIKNLSCSWGGGGPNATSESIFQQMAAQGQSFFNATGDSDAFTGAVPFPSDSPNITQVGGTTLTMNGAGVSYASETVWNQGYNSTIGQYVGSSGGVSTFYALPSWQQGINMTASHGSTVGRNLPDVALTGDNVHVRYNNGGSGTFGGTSVAAPLWAGFMALVNQQAASVGAPSAGFINPAVYALAKSTNYNLCFHDTTAGNNFWPGSPTNFPAAAGYDLCTGWGTPAGTNLINALAFFGSGPSILQNGNFETGDFSRWTLNGNGIIGGNVYTAVVGAGSLTGGAETNFIHTGNFGAFLGDSPQIGVISQTLVTSPGQDYLLSFWLANPASGSVQQFLVNWNTNSTATNQIYYLLNPPVLAWTNLSFILTATGTNTALQFGGRNDNNGFGLDDVSVTPIPAPSIIAFTKTSGTFNFSWNSLAGVAYQLQFSTNLLNPSWANLGAAINATSNITVTTNLPGPDPQRFYRIKRLP